MVVRCGEVRRTLILGGEAVDIGGKVPISLILGGEVLIYPYCCYLRL